ncbi:unnamed protein product [Aphanomyces euteiches]
METKVVEGDASKLLHRATKLVQTATIKKHGLSRSEVFNLLQECFSPEAATPCKILGFRLAELAPSCITTEIWQLILDTAIKELAGAATQGSAPILLQSIPVFEVLPLTLILSFFQQQELEPLKKIQACLSHESIEVRCIALATFSRVSLACIKVLFARGLTRFPFESNEARIVAQQDVSSILTDIWKLNVQAAELESPNVAAEAFSNLAHLFGRSHTIRALSTKQPRQESGIDELVAWVFNQASPRFEILKTNAQRLTGESQLFAMKWLCMVVYIMMQKSGACTPGIAIAIMEIDSSPDENVDKSTVRVRADLLASEMVESWCLPAYLSVFTSKGKTNQSYEIFRALVEALLVCRHPNVAQARLVVLREFLPVLANKTVNELRTATLVLYTSLLTQLCQDSCPARPVVAFLETEVLPLAPKVQSANVRVQMYWLGLKYIPSSQFQFTAWIENEFLELQSSKDGTGIPPPTYNDGILGGGKENLPVIDSHLLSRFHALIICLKSLLTKDPSLKQYSAQLLSHVRERNRYHRVICETVLHTIEEITGMGSAMIDTRALEAQSAFVLPDLFTPAALFPARAMSPIKALPVKWKEEVDTVVTGSCDPLCLKISYREPEDHAEEIALCITCCNVSNVPWSDFSISVGVSGPVKLVDTSNNMHIRVTGEVKPHGTFRSEKLFRFLRFSRARFFFRVVIEPTAPEQSAIVMGLSNPYHMPFDALFQLPEPSLWTQSYYQNAWQRAESSKVYNVKANPGMKIVPNAHIKVAYLPEMSVESPVLVQMSFMTWTKWKECVCATISCVMDSAGGRGTIDIRAPVAVLEEIVKAPGEFLYLLVKSAMTLQAEAVAERPVACVSPRHQIMKRAASVDVMARESSTIATTPTVTRRALMSFFGKS